MPNSFFQFKQFTVHQDSTAMKVCTDACLFGAWMAHQVLTGEKQPANILDLGTGTGLLSLMLAQQSPAMIDAVEIEKGAAGQATENFAASPWKNRLRVIHADAKTAVLSAPYDLIISNPPFFENDLRSVDDKRNLALHSKELDLSELMDVINNSLSETGNFAVLLPYHRKKYFEELAKTHHYHLHKEVNVRQTPKHDFFRTMLLFSRQEKPVEKTELSIRDTTGYSPDFIFLLKDYYLNL